MIITTARKRAAQLESAAKKVAQDVGHSYKARNDRSVEELIAQWKSDLLVVGANRLTLYSQSTSVPFFYHPNAAAVRSKAYLNSGYDVFVEACGLRAGDQVLDCTLGLAADAVIAKLAVGPTGTVCGIEANPVVAYMVQSGLTTWEDADEPLLKAMRSIKVLSGQHEDLLAQLPDESYDVVYFDPMFEVALDASTGIQGLKHFARYQGLSQEVVNEAIRVAKRRVVLKDHWQSTRFSEYGFQVKKRKLAKFHYGIIDKETEIK
ncbi:class I SAM-dependent methyltransferase [Alkalicoccobacillus murimartini]|uniref:Ubiquinone/menaquinone biosynthesis C-methylase UbiE n=1 Tax=Alkalicoccobacillus murimartini TaxID=171685 RepID=A0ABT9YEI3_9BACI|nr:class I SAM-dependent methyltransferase [Alkalicoccobacillus murimartini]MDQ0206260.1 ubiquinone/menaquinone biosynthesis C-methylase UbiE [Alkalicoccobacillus murimartini]